MDREELDLIRESLRMQELDITKMSLQELFEHRHKFLELRKNYEELHRRKPPTD